jgi:predicted MPP superfamily phosphohydrolase
MLTVTPMPANTATALGRLPEPMEVLTIVQLTDLHVGPTIGRAWLEEIVRRANGLRPDVVVITGDLADGRVEQDWRFSASGRTSGGENL